MIDDFLPEGWSMLSAKDTSKPCPRCHKHIIHDVQFKFDVVAPALPLTEAEQLRVMCEVKPWRRKGRP